MKYIFFDLDGTLLNTRDGIVKSIQKTIASSGIIIDDLCLLEKHIGPPMRDTLIECYGFDERTAILKVEEYRKHYKELGIPGTKPYDGVEEGLKALKMQGYSLCVATSKPEHIAKEFLDYFQLSKYFEHICGSIEDGSKVRDTKGKVIRYALETMHLKDSDDVIMIGDRSHDVEGSLENGIECIGVLYGFGSKKELLDAGAIYVFKDFKELVEYLLKENSQ